MVRARPFTFNAGVLASVGLFWFRRDGEEVCVGCGDGFKRRLRGGRCEEEESGDDNEKNGDAEDGAFGANGAAAVELRTEGVRGEEAALHESSGVGDAVEERLGPVPCGVEADGPPERAGAPQGNDENDAGEEDLEEAEGVFASVVGVGKDEERGGEEGGDPEGDGAGVAGCDAVADGYEAAGEGELKITAHGVLLREADQKERDELDGSPEEDGGTVVELGVEGKEVGGVEDEDEEAHGGEAPQGSDEEALGGAGAAESEGGEAAVFYDGHEPTEKK